MREDGAQRKCDTCFTFLLFLLARNEVIETGAGGHLKKKKSQMDRENFWGIREVIVSCELYSEIYDEIWKFNYRE